MLHHMQASLLEDLQYLASGLGLKQISQLSVDDKLRYENLIEQVQKQPYIAARVQDIFKDHPAAKDSTSCTGNILNICRTPVGSMANDPEDHVFMIASDVPPIHRHRGSSNKAIVYSDTLDNFTFDSHTREIFEYCGIVKIKIMHLTENGSYVSSTPEFIDVNQILVIDNDTQSEIVVILTFIIVILLHLIGCF